MRPLALALALASVLVPTAAAVDLLPTEVDLAETEARILVRSRDGEVRVEATPAVLAAASAPGGPAGDFGSTPRSLAATHTWHGLDGVVVVVLQRADAGTAVDVVVEDGSLTGVWLEWPAARSFVPAPGVAIAGLALIAAAKGFALRARSRR